MTPGIWSHSINHISYTAAVSSRFCSSPSPHPQSGQLLSSLYDACRASHASTALLCLSIRICLYLCTTNYYLLAFCVHFLWKAQWIAQIVACLRQKKCFYNKKSFASHSWCGGVPACSHRGRPWCYSCNCKVKLHFGSTQWNKHHRKSIHEK